MNDKEIVKIQGKDGTFDEVEVVTYLISDDTLHKYLVYTKGEVQGVEEDHVIYISRILEEKNGLVLTEIIDDEEWINVQKLLKKIANSN